MPVRSSQPHLDRREETDAISRAQVWQATNVAAMDIRNGPRQPGAFRPRATIRCHYVEHQMGGRTPKFTCAIGDDHLKVKYGRDNGEVYAEVAATRLLWALGFGADQVYPVRVLCQGCPAAIHADRRDGRGVAVFDYATVERKMKGRELLGPKGAGWAWSDLDQVNPAVGGASIAQRDALKLLAVILQHTDSKREQQRLACLDAGVTRHGELRTCERPFLLIDDLGKTFGKANAFNRDGSGSVNLKEWQRASVWQDSKSCTGNLPKSLTGTLDNPIISEAGRQFLAARLSQITERQMRDLFSVARFNERSRERGHEPESIQEWVETFKAKIAEVANHACPPPAQVAAATTQP